ncbi:uncharacterized protein LOC124953593 [Vespa velutina]|uniref:uncharacterized protein LOC124953593 n=1 Tax=Vespa velutina TaxID=202808 RepID=UPI001FB46F3C|nr:uncharacterized protein LOC124953593 [Vespa velutina]
MHLIEIDVSFDAIAKRFACKRRSVLPLTLKLIIFINVFYCEAQGNVTPYTIKKTSLGLIRRIHRDDSSIKGPIVDWREENQQVSEHTEYLENLRSSKNTNKSIHFDLSSFLNATKNITKAEKTMCCKMHDWCYDATECPIFMEYIAPYYWRCYHGYKPVCAVEHGKWGGSGSCAQRLCECDRSLAECLRRYPCPTTKAVCTSSPWRLVQNLFMIM